MYIKSIDKQIEELGPDKIAELQQRFTFKGITPYPYQCVMYNEIGKRIAKYRHPFFVKASVSAGKTIGFAMVAKRCNEMGLSMMILARQAEIVSQDSEEITNFGVPNSVYCAGLNTKSAYFPVVVGSEGTVANGLFKALGDFTPMVLGIDECHQVDWEDLADAIANNETYDQMSRGDDEPYMVDGVVVDRGAMAVDERLHVVVKGTKRAQYTMIIMELMRRCKEVHGKELRIFGMTGSEFRGTTPILVTDPKAKGFWREQVTNIDTHYLVKFGSVVPTVFGDTGGIGYDLSEFTASAQDGTADFGSKEMRRMEQKIHDDATMTQQIMQQVVRVAEARNAVLITCAGQRHCKEAAAALPPGSTYAIITEKTGAKQRKEILDKVRAGEIKYTFQVMALTTGVNVTNWDLCVILRKIGSLTLLIQLIGRVMRLLKQDQVEAGMVKNDCMVLDYAGTMDELGQLYFDPMLEEAQFQSRFRSDKDPKKCELCGTMNSFYARRCVAVDHLGRRCEHFWKARKCEDQIDDRTGKVIHQGCGTLNDIVARVCRNCDVTLLDPNGNLTGKAYSKNDWCDVLDFDIIPTKNQRGVVFKYRLRDVAGEEFSAYESFFPQSSAPVCHTMFRQKAVLVHVADKEMQRYLCGVKNAIKIVAAKKHFARPVRVTHRRNQKGEDIISRKDFGGADGSK